MSRVPAGSFGVLSALLFTLLGSCSSSLPAPDEPAELVLLNGTVLTVNASNAVERAVAVTGGRIVFVGGQRGARRYIGPDTVVVDLEGQTLVPGFVDAHSHFPGTGLSAVGVVDLNSPPLGTVTNLSDLSAALAARVALTPAGEWVQGIGYDDTLLAEGRHPTRTDLDAISVEHPIYLQHISGHLGVLNTAGLELMGIDSATPNPAGGVIRREADGQQPNGVLEELANDVVAESLLDFSLTESIAIAEAATNDYLAAGVTTAQSGLTTPALAGGLATLATLRQLRLRLVIWPNAELAEQIDSGAVSFSASPDMLTFGAVKLVADGSIQGYSGYLSEPYHVAPAGHDSSYRGYPRQTAAELAAEVLRFHEAGWQLAVHGNGDAAIDDILDAVEAAQQAHPRADARTILVHAQMAREDQLDRMLALGVTPSFFSLHTYYWGDRHRDIFMGPERAARMSPSASAVDRGLRFTIHTDSPIVPMRPLRLMWSAVNRVSTSGAVIGAAQRISATQALRAVTIDAAWQVRLEDSRGSIEVGKLADFVALSDNPLERPDTMADITVTTTWVGGQERYTNR